MGCVALRLNDYKTPQLKYLRQLRGGAAAGNVGWSGHFSTSPPIYTSIFLLKMGLMLVIYIYYAQMFLHMINQYIAVVVTKL